MTGLGYSHLKMEGAGSCPACGTPVNRFDLEPCVQRQHTLDEVTKNCTACGATHEALLDNLAPFCIPDGQVHSRKPTQFDPIQVS